MARHASKRPRTSVLLVMVRSGRNRTPNRSARSKPVPDSGIDAQSMSAWGSRVPNSIFPRIHLSFTGRSPIPGRGFRAAARAGPPNRAGSGVARLSFSGEFRASAQDSHMRISGKVTGEGVECPPYLVVYPTERGCHGQESQEGEEGEEGSQEEVIRAFDFMARAQMPEPSLLCFWTYK